MRSHEQERPPIQCSRGVGILRRKLIVLQTLLLGLQTFESLRDQRWRGLTFQVSTQDELPSHLLSWHLFEPRVLIEPLPECSKDLVEARLVLLGHTPWRVAAGHLAPLEGFMTSVILTAWCGLWSASRGCELLYLNHQIRRPSHFRLLDHEQGATTGLFTAGLGIGSIVIW